MVGFRNNEKAKADFPKEVYNFLSKEELSDLLTAEGFVAEYCKHDVNRKQSFFGQLQSKDMPNI